MKVTFKRSAIAIAVAAFAASGAVMAEAVDGVSEVNGDYNKSSDLQINNGNTEFNNEVNFTETDSINTTTNRVENSTENHVSNDTTNVDVDTVANETHTSSVSNTSTENHTASSDNSMTYSHDENISGNMEVNGSMSKSLDYSEDKSLSVDSSNSSHFGTAEVYHDVNKEWEETKDVNVNVTEVEMVKKLSLSKNLSITGGITVGGEVEVDSASVAVIDDKQKAKYNGGHNYLLRNTAEAGDDVMREASGNLGLNMASGDNNLQDNAAAMTGMDDAEFEAGLIDAEVFVRQTAKANHTHNQGVENLASLGSNAFRDASGNIGVNIATGNNNLQKNNMAVSVGTGALAEASVHTEQNVHNNYTSNTPLTVYGEPGEPGETSGHIEWVEVTYTAEGPAEPYDSGDISGGRYTTAEGGYSGDEAGEFGGSIEGTYEGEHSGDLAYDASAVVDLGGQLTGQVPVWVLDNCGGAVCDEETVIRPRNVATLGGQAFMGATGNIGINMSAGTNNVQSNSISMAVIPTPAQ